MDISLDNKMNDNTVDDHVDEEVKECIRMKKNFFMFAGAGSGKTRSLVNTLIFIADKYGKDLRLHSKQVAVITYTNAACDEIMRRIGYNPLFAVSTIHSFLWELIKSYQRDIKIWVKKDIEAKISELKEKQSKARSKDYSPDINKKQERLNSLTKISKFIYNPNGENVGRDSLNHSEVISMGSAFINEHKTMQKVMISRFPILLIDESQDTKKELVDALLNIEQEYSKNFIIGMFGDTMQRIYTDGKEDLDATTFINWKCPAKEMNHRSTKRIIQLANAIRNTIDKQKQKARSDKSDGIVRLFIVPNTVSKANTERNIFSQMAKFTNDYEWEDPDKRKILVLEHSMAASRIGFETLNESLARKFDQGFRDGSLVELSFLMKVIYPLVEAKRKGNNFAVMKILREHSTKFKENTFLESIDKMAILQNIRTNVTDLTSLWDNKDPQCLAVYKKLREIKLFDLPKRIDDVLSDSIEVDEKIIALREGLNVPFSELIKYWDYVNDCTQFSTHQGVKGLEFDRVAVIMDDEAAGGFLFSYEKLFGAKNLSDTDKRNINEGKDNTLTRTMRLFYVTCTRAKESLALIAYTSDVEKVKQTALSNKWFTNDEIVCLI
ncbi:hypothetical protein R84B8_00841 [Treponema sp. R8-4-B8]